MTERSTNLFSFFLRKCKILWNGIRQFIWRIFFSRSQNLKFSIELLLLLLFSFFFKKSNPFRDQYDKTHEANEINKYSLVSHRKIQGIYRYYISSMLNQAAVLRHVSTPREIKLALTADEPIWQRRQTRSTHFSHLLFSRSARVRFRSPRTARRRGESGRYGNGSWIITKAKESAAVRNTLQRGILCPRSGESVTPLPILPSEHSNFDTFRERASFTERRKREIERKKKGTLLFVERN